MDNVKTSAPASIRWLLSFVRPHRRAVWLTAVFGFVGGIAATAEPFLIGVIVDHVIRGYTPTELLPDIALLLVLAMVAVAAFFGQRYFSGIVAYSVEYDVRQTLYDKLLTFENAFYQRNAVGDLISRMHSDIRLIWMLVAMFGVRFSSAVTSLVLTLALLMLVNVPLTLLVFIVLSVSTYFQMRVGLVIAPMFERVQDQTGVLSALVQDSISGVQTLKTFGKEGSIIDRFRAENVEYRRRWLYFKRRYEPVGMLPNMISQLAVGIVVLFGGVLTVQGALTLGNFTQFLFYLLTISTTLLQLGTIYQRYQQAVGAIARLLPLMRDADIADAEDAQSLTTPQGAVRFEHVDVAIDAHPILHSVDLDIPAGSVVGLVGATGAGKTVLVSLLARALDPVAGCVLVDGVDVRHLRLDQLRRAVAYVPQTTFLFSATLRENIRMNNPAVTDADIDRVVQIARVVNDLPQMPEGLETLVGEKGVMLSGGQKQRVAIARALARDPAILVLDDALSSVDTQTAADILRELRGVLRQRTSFIIAHRIATVKDADLILVMDQGTIRERGTHDSLVAQGGLYTAMVAREMDDDSDAVEKALVTHDDRR